MPLQRLLEMVRRAGGSISIRITAYFTLVACILLLVAVMFLQWALSRNLFGEDRQFLHDKVHVIRDILAVHPLDWDSLHEEFQWEGRTFRYTHYYARLLDAKGTIRIETARMRQVIPMNVFPLPKESGSAGEKGTRWQENGRTFLLMSAWAQPHKPALGEIQLALDVTREDHMIAAYRQELALVLLAGILLAAGMGAFAARRALKPLEAITRNARQVSFETLGTRLGATRWPRELESLARAFDEMLERLEQSYTRLSQFSADIAHELRTPIHNMMGEAEV
ncbi:MAG: HAMP domain-containing protein, partial [Pseudomonadota bacterium]|nr:HAMP domain-containing protein [Pseudomonadota bacterium]